MSHQQQFRQRVRPHRHLRRRPHLPHLGAATAVLIAAAAHTLGAPAAATPTLGNSTTVGSAVGARAESLSWTATRTVTDGVDFNSRPPADLAVGRGGRAAVIYTKHFDIRVRQLTDRGRWSQPVTIGSGRGPSLVLDRSGTLTAAWIRGGFDVVAARKPVGGRWSDPRQISPPTPDPHEDVVVGAFEVNLAGNRSGAVAAAWTISSMDDDSFPFPAQMAYRPAGGRWGQVRTIEGDVNSAVAPYLAVRGNGDVVAIYSRSDPAAIKIRERIVGQGWTPARQLADTFGNKDVAVGGGSTVAVWITGSGADSVLSAAHRRAGEGWQPPVILATTAIRGAPAITVDGAGRATIAWSQDGQVRTRTSDPAGTWDSAASHGPAKGPVALTGNHAGDLVLAWRAPGTQKVRAAYRPAGQPWDADRALGPGARPLPGVHPNGDVTVVWRQGSRLVSRLGAV